MTAATETKIASTGLPVPVWAMEAYEAQQADLVLWSLADMLARDWCAAWPGLREPDPVEMIAHRCCRNTEAKKLLANLLAMPVEHRRRLAKRLTATA